MDLQCAGCGVVFDVMVRCEKYGVWFSVTCYGVVFCGVFMCDCYDVVCYSVMWYGLEWLREV